MPSPPGHYHTLVVARCRKDPDDRGFFDSLKPFLNKFIRSIGMNVLIKPIVRYGKFGFTGLAGIVTSHIAFHYFESSCTLQFDVYSCRAYEVETLLRALDDFWEIECADVVFIRRDATPALEQFRYSERQLRPAKELLASK